MRISSNFTAPRCRSHKAAFANALVAAYQYHSPRKMFTLSIPLVEQTQGKQMGGDKGFGGLASS